MAKKTPKRRPPHLTDKHLKSIVPMFVESGNNSADHKCGSCLFRVGSDQCAIVKGDINFKNGTCMFWAKGKAMSEPNPTRMDKGTAQYLEVKNGQKVNCASCAFYEKGICKLWSSGVHAGDCCMAWK